MKATVIPVVIGAFGTVTGELVQGNSSGQSTANAGVKNSQKSKIYIFPQLLFGNIYIYIRDESVQLTTHHFFSLNYRGMQETRNFVGNIW